MRWCSQVSCLWVIYDVPSKQNTVEFAIRTWKHLHTHTHTHTHRRVNGASRWLSTPASQVTGTHFPKQHFIFAFFLFGVVAIWTPGTYFHLAAESLQDCQHFKRAKPFTLLQWINQNIKIPLCYLFIYLFSHKLCYILGREREASSLQKKKSPVSSNKWHCCSGVQVILL